MAENNSSRARAGRAVGRSFARVRPTVIRRRG
ncbi:Uncharacterised protein [Chryseobacterium carnipullorum]|uniref:Uncharacterized protein n=1 Tax=Chryseobacterium carnipullorum TaxID=1124835 RepID=A0A376DTT7_CHRCU|nr:Uncharacterised protein [Chryseobacterium carnipullorum]